MTSSWASLFELVQLVHRLFEKVTWAMAGNFKATATDRGAGTARTESFAP